MRKCGKEYSTVWQAADKKNGTCAFNAGYLRLQTYTHNM